MGTPPNYDLWLRLSPTAQRLLGLVVEMYARGITFIRDRWLAGMLSVDARTLRRCRAELIEQGYLHFTRRAQEGKTGLYSLTPRLAQLIAKRQELSAPPSGIVRPRGKLSAHNDKDSTTKDQYDLPLPDAVIRGDLPRLVPATPDQKRKAGEFPTGPRLTPPEASGPTPLFQKLAQGRADLKALERDQEERKARDPEHGQEVKRGPGQKHRSYAVAPLGKDSYHEHRGRDFSKSTGGENQAGQTLAEQQDQTAEDQGRARAEAHAQAQRERQKHLPGPVR